MKVLFSSANSRLPYRLGMSFDATHDVFFTDRSDIPGARRFLRSALGHDNSTNELVTGTDLIVHSVTPDAEDSVSERLDYAMRGTYNLLHAASEEGVPRVILLSSLSIVERYGDSLSVRETWRPTVTTDTDVVCHHLAEYVCKEFAREKRIRVVCLRLGDIVWNPNSKSVSDSGLYFADAVRAVGRTMNAEISWWNVFHIQSDVPGSRYPTSLAKHVLEFDPTGIL